MKVISKQQAYAEITKTDYLFCNNCLKFLFFVDIKIKVNKTNIVVRCKNCNKIIKFKDDNSCSRVVGNWENISFSSKSL